MVAVGRRALQEFNLSPRDFGVERFVGALVAGLDIQHAAEDGQGFDLGRTRCGMVSESLEAELDESDAFGAQGRPALKGIDEPHMRSNELESLDEIRDDVVIRITSALRSSVAL